MNQNMVSLNHLIIINIGINDGDDDDDDDDDDDEIFINGYMYTLCYNIVISLLLLTLLILPSYITYYFYYN